MSKFEGIIDAFKSEFHMHRQERAAAEANNQSEKIEEKPAEEVQPEVKPVEAEVKPEAEVKE